VGEETRANERREKPTFELPLRTVLIAAFLVQAVLAVGLVGVLSFRSGRNAVNEAVQELQGETGARIEEHLLTFLDTPHLINRLNAIAIREGLLSVTDPDALERYLWLQVQAFPSVSSVYVASPDGGIVDAGREGAGGSLYVIATDGFESGEFRKYSTDNEGRRIELLQVVPGFDARTRGWYKSAVGTGGAAWSEIYVLFSGQDMAISASLPVYDHEGTLLAVVASDLFLSQIGEFLADLRIGETGVGFIVERSGLLVATSIGSTPIGPGIDGSEPTRHRACESADETICEASRHAIAELGSYAEIRSPWESSFVVDGERYALRMTPLPESPGIDWIAATVIPESDFMAQISANTTATLYLLAAAALTALLVGIIVSERITRPIVRLKASAERLASGRWEPVSSKQRIREVGELAESLNATAGQLQETVASLKREIVERRRTETELRASEARYSLLANHVADVIWTLDLDGRFTYVSPSVQALLGFSPEEILAQPIEALLTEAAREVVDTGLERLRTTIDAGRPVELEERFELEQRCKDGSTVWTETILSGLSGPDGQFLGILGVSRDITARRRAEQERRDIETQLRQSQKLESIGTMASGVAHEINNPLTGIINYADLIESRIEDGKLKEYARGIIQEGKRVAEIVRSLLSFARQETGQFRNVGVESLVQSSARLFSSALRRDQIRLVLDVPADLPPVRCRSQQIEQVLINLIANACDALNLRYRGHDEKKVIRISSRAIERNEASWVRTTVEDAGVGIPPETIQRIFDPFFTTKPRNEGTGLGLSVSYGIIKEHGGDLTVESEPGEGTRFHIDLPTEGPRPAP